MTNSILLTTKKLLGISEEYHAFDIDILTNINAVFLTLNQLGVGPTLPFQLPLMVDPDDADDPAIAITWDDFLGNQKEYLAAVQTYVYQRVRLMFDPPTNSFLVDAMQKSCQEFEWRFTVQPKTSGAVEDVDSRKVIYEGDNDAKDEPVFPSEEPPFEPTESTEGTDVVEGTNNGQTATVLSPKDLDLYDIFK